jgi:hypothetical protein
MGTAAYAMRRLKNAKRAPGISNRFCSAEASDACTDDHHINICHGMSLSAQLVPVSACPADITHRLISHIG